MPLVTYGYHNPPELPERITVDGVEYRRIARLPRNLRPGDLLAIGDNTDRDGYHRAFVTVTDIQSWPQEIRGWHRYAPRVQVSFRLPGHLLGSWRWSSWGNRVTFYDSETRERMDWAYRAVGG